MAFGYKAPMRVAVVVSLVALAACEGPPGPAGGSGDPGVDGQDGSNGDDGIDGTPPPPSPWLVGAGVDIAVTDLVVSASAATVHFTLADAAGRALDRTGFLTEGSIAVSFVLAQLPTNSDGSPGALPPGNTTP